MRPGPVVALLALFAAVAAILAVPARQPSVGDWGPPLVHETLADEGWRSRWGVQSGRHELRKGRLITSGDKESRILLRQPLAGPVAVEFTVEILPGARPCDITVDWFGEAEFAKDGSVTRVGDDYHLQLGALDNAFSWILDPRGRVLAYSDFRLTVGRTYRVRAELGGDELRLFADGREVLRSYQPYPLGEGYLGLRFYYPGKAVSDITVWQPPMREAASARSQAEGLARRRLFSDAGPAYQRAAQQVSPALRGRMLYGAARSYELAKDATAAAQAWAALRGTDHEALGTLHELEQAFDADDHQAIVTRFAAAYGACPERFRDQYAIAWATWVNTLRGRWAPLDTYQRYLDVYLSSLTRNLLADRAASELLLLLKRDDEVVARFPRQASICSKALMEMGRAEEALERFKDVPLVKYAILTELGRYNEALLEGPKWSIPFTMLAMGKYDEVIEQYPGSRIQVAIALQSQGHLEEVITRFPDLTAIRIDCLAGLGRFDEALALAGADESQRMNVLLRMGRAEEASRLCERDFAMQQTARDLLGLQACIAGRLDEARSRFTPATPFVFSWPTYGFRRYIMEAALFGMMGDSATRTGLLREAAGMATVWHGRLPAYAAVLTGETPIDQAAATMRGEGVVALAVAQEQAGDQAAALASYRRYLAENPLGDHVVQHFVQWRIGVLAGPSAAP
jgi:hypothetical protein